MSDQLPLPLPHRPALGPDDFLVGASNARAIEAIDRYPDWPNPVLIVIGPAGSGKTHLAHVFRSVTAAETLDIADIRAETLAGHFNAPALILEDVADVSALPEPDAFFLLVDTAQRRRLPLLITSRSPVSDWRIARADTLSRLGLAQSVRLDPPDDALVAGLIVKLFADRQVAIAPEVVRYIVERGERSFHAINRLVDRLDRAALARRAPIGKALVRAVLDQPPEEIG